MKQFLFLLILFIGLPSLSYEIAFPHTKNETINLNGIFFAGKVNDGETVWINGKKVDNRKNGAFAESFKLNMGKNVFCIKSSEGKQEEYIVKRFVPKSHPKITEEFPPKTYQTTCDNVILRSTPIDFGMNRLGYLPKHTDLLIAGRKNEFSRVYLNKNQSGWVMTKHIKECSLNKLAKFEGKCFIENKYTYKFSKNLPYSMKFKNGSLLVNVYNISNSPTETFSDEIKLEKPYCYSVRMQDGVLNITLIKHDITNPKIIIDAGHGGKEKGAYGCLGDIEKDMNLQAAKAVRDELKSLGYDVSMTRNWDKFLSLNDRVDYARDKEGTLFISMHMNSVPENINPSSHRGSETYYYNEFSKPLADSIQHNIVKTIATNNRGVIQASYAVIRPTEYVGVLVETAYVVNPDDVEIYKSKDFYKNIGIGVANGVDEYLKQLKN